MENRSHALMAGIFTIVLLLASAVALWWFSGSREPMATYILETRGNVTGLNFEAQVRYRGIRAGKVRDIRPDERDPKLLLVEIVLASRFPLTDRTVAKLNYQGVTGLAYIMLEETGEGQGVPLDTASAVPPRIRIQPGFIEKLGDKAGDIAGQIAELTLRMNHLLDDRNVQNIARSVDNLAQASEGLKELPKIMASLRQVLSDDNLRRLRSTLQQVEKTTGEAAPLVAEARQLVTSLTDLAQQVDAVGGRVNADTLPRAEMLMQEVAVATRRLNRLMDTLNDTPQAVLFGTAPGKPGPGETGFVPQRQKE